jgi:lipopolysaccharide export system permease protein
VLAVVGLRIAGFAAASAAVRSPAAVVAMYGVPLAAIALASLVAFQGPRVRAFNAGVAQRLRGLVALAKPARPAAQAG